MHSRRQVLDASSSEDSSYQQALRESCAHPQRRDEMAAASTALSRRPPRRRATQGYTLVPPQDIGARVDERSINSRSFVVVFQFRIVMF